MNITYLHGVSIRLTFLDYFTLLLSSLLNGCLWEWVSLMQLYDIIRQFQVAVLILCFNFVITTSSSHKLSPWELSTTLLASKKKYKRTNENKNIPCDYLYSCYLEVPLPDLTFLPCGSLIFANAARLMSILHLTSRSANIWTLLVLGI